MYYLHIDCNSYFASCEIATRPELRGKPVVVANANEKGGGVVLALNAEAKATGLTRGIPLFKAKQLIEQAHVVVCPADHDKYHAISDRIMQTVIDQGIVQDFVQYSIDEFFGTLPIDDPTLLRSYTQKVKNLIWQATSIPVGCGCSQTYTLAKVATHYAKRYPAYGDICILPPESREKALAQLPIGEVWGIGRRLRQPLIDAGYTTALALASAPQSALEPLLTTAGLRTYLELRGIPSITLRQHPRRKSIMQSRTFAEMTSSAESLEAALATFTNQCCSTLRQQHSLCSTVTIFLATNPYRTDLLQYSNQASTHLDRPTADTPTILRTVSLLLRSIFRPGYLYKRAGVLLTGIIADEGHQLNLFSHETDRQRSALMSLADDLNRRFGKSSLTFGHLPPSPPST